MGIRYRFPVKRARANTNRGELLQLHCLRDQKPAQSAVDNAHLFN
jgi:hypothetical protein